MAASATAQLVINASRFVSLRADNAEPASSENDVTIGGAGELCLRECGGVGLCVNFSRVEALDAQRFGGEACGISAKHDVRSATSHVGCNCHRTRASRLRDNRRFTFVLLRVQDVVFHPFALQQPCKVLRALN